MKKFSVSMTSAEKRLGWLYWALQLFAFPTLLPMLLSHWNRPFSDAQTNFIFFALNFLCLTVIMRRFLGKNAQVAMQQPFLILRSAFFGYLGFWVFNITSNIVVRYFIPDFFNTNDAAIDILLADNYTLTAIGTVLLAPVAEELIYRGLFFDTLYRRSPVAAFIASTVVFASIHVMEYITLYDPLTFALSFVLYIPAGLLLGFAYTHCGNIWAPILMHIAINQTNLMIMR